ncbi:SDR family oxidoreductase [Sinorhizobium meliloti]|nr:SDR family oxidoreductase [Sinorhizobium meliloti]
MRRAWPAAPVLELTDEEWHRVGCLFLNVRANRLVDADHGGAEIGSIVNISTYAASNPTPCFRRRGSSVPGLRLSPKPSPIRVCADNVRMNNVLPGFIDSLPETEERRQRIPMGRYGASEEVAELIALLASDRGGYITGQEHPDRRRHHPIRLTHPTTTCAGA